MAAYEAHSSLWWFVFVIWMTKHTHSIVHCLLSRTFWKYTLGHCSFRSIGREKTIRRLSGYISLCVSDLKTTGFSRVPLLLTCVNYYSYQECLRGNVHRIVKGYTGMLYLSCTQTRRRCLSIKERKTSMVVAKVLSSSSKHPLYCPFIVLHFYF